MPKTWFFKQQYNRFIDLVTTTIWKSRLHTSKSTPVPTPRQSGRLAQALLPPSCHFSTWPPRIYKQPTSRASGQKVIYSQDIVNITYIGLNEDLVPRAIFIYLSKIRPIVRELTPLTIRAKKVIKSFCSSFLHKKSHDILFIRNVANLAHNFISILEMHL